MSDFLAFARLLAMIGGGLIFALIVSLSLPQSRLKEIVMPILGFGVSAASAVYCLSPIDLLPEIVLGPFGLADDAIALVIGVASAFAAMNAGKDKKKLR